MADKLPPIEFKSGMAPSFGWLRRPELDTASVDVWEWPDGKLYAAEKGKTPKLARYPSLAQLMK